MRQFKKISGTKQIIPQGGVFWRSRGGGVKKCQAPSAPPPLLDWCAVPGKITRFPSGIYFNWNNLSSSCHLVILHNTRQYLQDIVRQYSVTGVVGQ